MPDLQRTFYPHKWSPVSCRSSTRQGKFASQRPTFYRCATQPTLVTSAADLPTRAIKFCSVSFVVSVIKVFCHKQDSLTRGAASSVSRHQQPLTALTYTPPALLPQFGGRRRNILSQRLVEQTTGQSNLTKSSSRGAHSPVRGHPRGSKVVPLNSWGRVSY